MDSLNQHVEAVMAVARGPIPSAHASGNDNLILRSWHRCVNKYGLNPTAPAGHYVETGAALRERRGQIEEYLQVARAGMEQLFKQVSDLGYVLMLTDAEGVTIDYIGNDSWDKKLKQAGLYLGSNWKEEYAGTNGIGTCVAEQKPISCHRSDHFFPTNINLSCNTVPLFDPEGSFMGVLDVSLLVPPNVKDSPHLAHHLTALYGQMIEDTNFMRHFRERWIIRLGTTWSLIDVCGELMLAFDHDGQIVGANTSARRALTSTSSAHLSKGLVGLHLTDLFKCTMDQIWGLARAANSLDRTTLGTLDHKIYYGAVVAPRASRSRSLSQMSESSAGSKEPECPALDNLAGDDKNMTRIIGQAKRLVNKKVNILIQGETGTGKEVFAKALHESSDRAKNPFIAVNCAAFPESLIESELFGYSSGAFTGARNKGMKGLIAQSNGGTLFLDEIGDMPLPLQTRLLRVLSEREVLPLGSDKPISVDLTVVAASHRDLRKQIAAGTFREDLYYRLCGATLFIPPLRERNDKEFIIRKILQDEAANLRSEADLDEGALTRLLQCSWPGNVRQLRNVLRYAIAIADGQCITVEHLPSDILEEQTSEALFQPVPHAPDIPETTAQPDTPPERADHPEAKALQLLLQKHRWNVTAVARELDVCRTTVYRHMKRFGIHYLR